MKTFRVILGALPVSGSKFVNYFTSDNEFLNDLFLRIPPYDPV